MLITFPSFAADKEITKYPIDLKFRSVSSMELSKLLNKEFPTKNIWKNAVGESTGEKTDFIYNIAEFDLNDDGENEIFLVISGYMVCGQLCSYNIYKKKEDGSFDYIISSNNYGFGSIARGKISEDTNNGHHNVIIGGKNGYNIWSFNGNKYVFNKKYEKYMYYI